MKFVYILKFSTENAADSFAETHDTRDAALAAFRKYRKIARRAGRETIRGQILAHSIPSILAI